MKPHEVALELVQARTRFLHQGRTINGIDCAGVVIYVGETNGYQVKDPGAYSREPSGGMLKRWLLANGCVEVFREPEIDDILLMQLRDQAEPGHLAIVAPHPEGLGLVHSYFSSRRVVYQILDATRRSEIRGIFEWPDKD